VSIHRHPNHPSHAENVALGREHFPQSAHVNRIRQNELARAFADIATHPAILASERSARLSALYAEFGDPRETVK